MATEIDKYGTPRTLRDPIPQQLANQSAMYVQGAQAAASMRNPTPQGDPMREAMGRVATQVQHINQLKCIGQWYQVVMKNGKKKRYGILLKNSFDKNLRQSLLVLLQHSFLVQSYAV